MKRSVLICIFLILFFSIYGESIKCPDGSNYEGALIDGVFNGYGEQYWNETLYYKGNYTNGKFDGKGLLVNGANTYEGEFSNGGYSGTEILTSNSGYKYVGTFENNLFHLIQKCQKEEISALNIQMTMAVYISMRELIIQDAILMY